MVLEASPAGVVETTLVFGLAAAIANLLIDAQQPVSSAWVDVVGPSRILALSLLVSFGTCLLRTMKKD